MRARTVPVPLAIGSLSLPGSVTGVRCLGCRVDLDWHQPDPDAPDRMLGICVACGRWHLVAPLPDEAGAVVVRLPDASDLRGALGR